MDSTPSPAELLDQALAHVKAGRLRPALEPLSQLLAHDPGHGEALYHQGLIQWQLRQVAEAEVSLRAALDQGGPQRKCRVALAEVSRGTRRLDESRAAYLDLLKAEPDDADLWNSLGNVERDRNDHEAALRAFERALTYRPRFPRARYNLANLFYVQGRFLLAVEHYKLCVEFAPRYADAHNNMGLAFKRLNRLEQATQCYRQAIEINPRLSEAITNLGNVLVQQKKYDEALETYEQAKAVAPKSPAVYFNIGNTLRAMERHEEAAEAYRQAIAFAPRYAEAHNNLGIALRSLGQTEEELACYKRALDLKPDYPEALSNYGMMIKDQGDLDGAMDCYRRAMIADPSFPEAHFHMGLAHLTAGAFAQGWEDYEWRWKCNEFTSPARPFTQPRWQGEALGDRTLLLWGEQGVGDEVMFARLLPLVRARYPEARLVAEVDARLVSLLSRSYDGITFYPRENPPLEALSGTAVDLQCPLGSLPRLFGFGVDSVPEPPQALQPDPERLARVKATVLRPDDPRPRVGIAWRSGNYLNGPKRSTTLDQWMPVLRQTGARFINLQYGDVEQELTGFLNRTGVLVEYYASIDPLKNLEDFAALLSQMDLVVSVDNSTVHFAGSLGRPVWALLPSMPDWRWMMERADSPWYPNVTLFRQPAPDDWGPVMVEVQQRMRKFFRGKR